MKHKNILEGTGWFKVHGRKRKTATGKAISFMAVPFELAHAHLHARLPHNRKFFLVGSGFFVMILGYYVGNHPAEAVPHVVGHTFAETLTALGSAPVVKVICDVLGVEV